MPLVSLTAHVNHSKPNQIYNSIIRQKFICLIIVGNYSLKQLDGNKIFQCYAGKQMRAEILNVIFV